AKTKAMTMPVCPPKYPPIATNSEVSPASNTKTLRLFIPISICLGVQARRRALRASGTDARQSRRSRLVLWTRSNRAPAVGAVLTIRLRGPGPAWLLPFLAELIPQIGPEFHATAVASRQSPVASRQSPVASRQSPVASRQSPAASRQPPIPSP